MVDLLCGVALGILMGAGAVGMYYEQRMMDYDRMIEALRKECGAPDPDSK